MYKTKVEPNGVVQKYLQNRNYATPEVRTILENGRLIDPSNGIDETVSVSLENGRVAAVGKIKPEKGDCVINCTGLQIWPGLIDMHLHLGDLFEVSTDPVFGAVRDGVTVGLSPGAGNTYLAPALLGAEVDRGLPLNIGVYLGAGSVLACSMSDDELIALFRGEGDADVLGQKLSRNGIACATAHLTVGIKDHMGHFIMNDDNIKRIYNITSKAGLVYMSHTQDPEHAERIVKLGAGKPIHLAHATAAGCGTHADAVQGFARVLNLMDGEQVTGEFVTTMLREGGGNREGLLMPKQAQKMAYSALADGLVDILISDGQGDATMKGFGDTRDNVPAILELAEKGVMTLPKAVAAMTSNPTQLLARRTGRDWFTRSLGHLGAGARANVTVVDPAAKRVIYTFVSGEIAAFEGRSVRRGTAAGALVSKFGLHRQTGIGQMTMFTQK